MTSEELKQVYFLKKELTMWQHRLNEIQADISISAKPIDGMPFPNTNAISHPVEDKAIKLHELNLIISGKIAEIQLAIADIEKFIMTVEDSSTRQILYYRCCQCKKWRDISKLMGEGYTDEAVRQQYHRFVRKM